MNFRIAFFFIFILSSCDNQDAFDCIQSIGHPITKEFITDNFDEILVNENIELTVKVGSLFSLKIQTGSNMMSGTNGLMRFDERSFAKKKHLVIRSQMR